MNPTGTQNLLSARYGAGRVTIGSEALETIRAHSNSRALTCPGCGSVVVLHAGTVRAHHFAHLPGAVCAFPQTEPESEEHREGKLLIARWLGENLKGAEITVEAIVEETGQRADVLVETTSDDGRLRRIAIEFQCANLSGEELRRRRRLYREAGIEDLWLLGGSRLAVMTADAGMATIGTTELERTLLNDGAPLLFLDADGIHYEAGTLVRFRPEPGTDGARRAGKLSGKALMTLNFPWALLGLGSVPAAAATGSAVPPDSVTGATAPIAPQLSDWALKQWLASRHQVAADTLHPFFGLPSSGQVLFACSAALWQAAIYYRFIYRRQRERWWLNEVETWVRAYVPLTKGAVPRRLRAALAEYQDILIAAGMLSQPTGATMTAAIIAADLTTLQAPPDREEVLRLARFRRTLRRD